LGREEGSQRDSLQADLLLQGFHRGLLAILKVESCRVVVHVGGPPAVPRLVSAVPCSIDFNLIVAEDEQRPIGCLLVRRGEEAKREGFGR